MDSLIKHYKRNDIEIYRLKRNIIFSIIKKRGGENIERKKASRKQLEYISKWSKQNQKSINFRLSKTHEKELIEIFESIPNKAEWFKECLRNYG